MPRILVTGGSGFIGTNSIQLLTERGSDVVNFDVTPPLWEAQAGQWVPGDIHDRPRLDSVLEAYAPEAVVHLAAETRVGPRFSLDHYSANTVGTQDLLQALQLHDGVERVIITSTQYVCRPGYVPARDEDYAPHTVYGYSTALSGSMVRRSQLDVDWCIVPPTPIWGPWDLKYRRDFYWSLRQGLYLHPRTGSADRSMGFVDNAIQQYAALLSAPTNQVMGQDILRRRPARRP